MTETNNILGLDVGERRIGVALGSLEAGIASPVTTIDRMETDAFIVIGELAEKHAASQIVIGLPRGLEGQETTQTTMSRRFAEELQKRCSATITLQDEAATSLKAKDELEARGRPYEKGEVDKLAATYILQDWLDEQRRKVTA